MQALVAECVADCQVRARPRGVEVSVLVPTDATITVDKHKIRQALGNLLDTQAIVYLALGRPNEAVEKLEAAVQQAPTGTRYFHLTQALTKAGRSTAARDAWQKATKDFQLKEKQIHPLERDEFRRLDAEYSKDKS